MGPCRFDPHGKGAHYGICAADADIISARNLIGSAVMNGFSQGGRFNVIARTSGKGVIY
jgi:hydroxylamine reductase (hybrid-cluster protein)